MKRLSVSLFFVLSMIVLFGTGFTLKKSTPIDKCQTLYYFYSTDDTYNDEKTLNDEITEMWSYYGFPVNTNSSGGTLIERGYLTNTIPHGFVSVFLYVHY